MIMCRIWRKEIAMKKDIPEDDSQQKEREMSEQAIAELFKSARHGDAQAQLELADRLREGNGMPVNLEDALHWYRMAAEARHPLAMNNLGSMLLNGMGCPADAKAAAIWFLAAAEAGDAVAQFNLGLRYLNGTGQEMDDKKAAEWIERSAEQGYSDAIGQLGTLYRFGRGVELDLLRACELHLIAAELGDVVSQGNLVDYLDELIALALSGSREAASALFKMYDLGLGVEKDCVQMWAWLRWAHDGCIAASENADALSAAELDMKPAFRFYLLTLDQSVKLKAEAYLSDKLAESGHSSSYRPILSILGEGGSIDLEARWLPSGWEFTYGTQFFCYESDQPAPVASWRAALKLLDTYPWHQLYPGEIHPEFADQVWRAYQKRWVKTGGGQEHDHYDWQVACGRRPAPAYDE
jgi:hypothetical protein